MYINHVIKHLMGRVYGVIWLSWHRFHWKWLLLKKKMMHLYIGSKEMKYEKRRKKMELDILKIFVLTVHPCTVFIHVLLLGVNISHIHVSLLVCFQFPI